MDACRCQVLTMEIVMAESLISQALMGGGTGLIGAWLMYLVQARKVRSEEAAIEAKVIAQVHSKEKELREYLTGRLEECEVGRRADRREAEEEREKQDTRFRSLNSKYTDLCLMVEDWRVMLMRDHNIKLPGPAPK